MCHDSFMFSCVTCFHTSTCETTHSHFCSYIYISMHQARLLQMRHDSFLVTYRNVKQSFHISTCNNVDFFLNVSDSTSARCRVCYEIWGIRKMHVSWFIFVFFFDFFLMCQNRHLQKIGHDTFTFRIPRISYFYVWHDSLTFILAHIYIYLCIRLDSCKMRHKFIYLYVQDGEDP